MSEREMQRVTCSECGRPGTRQIEPGFWGDKLRLVAYLCSECEDQATERDDRLEREQARDRRRQKCGIPDSLQGAAFTEFERGNGRREVIAAAAKWAGEHRPDGLVLFGDVGRGKTRLAAAAAWSRLDHSFCHWVSVPVLIARLTAAWDDDERAGALRVLTGKTALILDDLDKTSLSEWVRSQLFAAIDTRVAAGSPLLVTTNLNPSQLRDRLGEPIVSRLAGHCRLFELPGVDYRIANRRKLRSVA